ncbi:MAG TPA: hypothetical protein VGH28_27265 [Polyangiaceae bacterium]|jgi:hypothetical protein
MRDRAHAAIATMALALVTLACRSGSRIATWDASDVDASGEAAKLATLLPPTLGPFAATDSPMTTTGAGALIEARRTYAGPAGKRIDVRLATGDVRSYLGTIESDDEHTFGSDSPTYWRTTTVAGHRTRIAEEQPVVRTSECLVRIEPNHVADVTVSPASSGECAAVAAMLDFAAIEASGGVPGPPARR